MDFRAFASGIESFDFPTVITSEDITVSFFNEKFRSLVPNAELREPLGKYMKVKNLNELVKEAVAPCVAELNGKSCMCAYCRVGSDFEPNYSFSVSVPDGPDGSSLNYLTSKLAVLAKCESNGRSLSRTSSYPPVLCDGLHHRVEDCLDIADIAYRRNEYGAVEITSYLSDVFNYYTKMRYGEFASNVRIDAHTDYVPISNIFCLELISLFHFVSKASRNGRIYVDVREEDRTLRTVFTFRTPKRFSSAMFSSDGETNEQRICSALGFEGTDLVYAIRLAAESNGRIDIKFDGETVTASLDFPIITFGRLSSPGFEPPFQRVSLMLIRILLRKNREFKIWS